MALGTLSDKAKEVVQKSLDTGRGLLERAQEMVRKHVMERVEKTRQDIDQDLQNPQAHREKQEQAKAEIIHKILDPNIALINKEGLEIINTKTGTVRRIMGVTSNGNPIMGKLMPDGSLQKEGKPTRGFLEHPNYRFRNTERLFSPVLAIMPQKTQQKPAAKRVDMEPGKIQEFLAKGMGKFLGKDFMVEGHRLRVGEMILYHEAEGKKERQGTVIGRDQKGNLLIQPLGRASAVSLPPPLFRFVTPFAGRPLVQPDAQGRVVMGSVADIAKEAEKRRFQKDERQRIRPIGVDETPGRMAA